MHSLWCAAAETNLFCIKIKYVCVWLFFAASVLSDVQQKKSRINKTSVSCPPASPSVLTYCFFFSPHPFSFHFISTLFAPNSFCFLPLFASRTIKIIFFVGVEETKFPFPCGRRRRRWRRRLQTATTYISRTELQRHCWAGACSTLQPHPR